MELNNNLYTAIITPMQTDGKVDYISFEKILKYQAASGSGVLILGSTGEALSLSFEEQCEVVKFTCSLQLDTQIMVGVGGYQLEQQVHWIEFCNKQKIDSLLLVTPLYAKPGTLGQINWFNTLLDAAEKPCILYNVPSRTGINLCYVALESIKEHKNVWAIKEASGDSQRFAKYASIAPGLKMYSGEDGMLPALVSCGATGLISVMSNIWPKQVKEYVKDSVKGSLDNDAKQLWQQAADACFEVANPIPVKVWLAEKDIITNDTLRAPLIAAELINTMNLEKVDYLIKENYKYIN